MVNILYSFHIKIDTFSNVFSTESTVLIPFMLLAFNSVLEYFVDEESRYIQASFIKKVYVELYQDFKWVFQTFNFIFLYFMCPYLDLLPLYRLLLLKLKQISIKIIFRVYSHPAWKETHITLSHVQCTQSLLGYLSRLRTWRLPLNTFVNPSNI